MSGFKKFLSMMICFLAIACVLVSCTQDPSDGQQGETSKDEESSQIETESESESETESESEEETTQEHVHSFGDWTVSDETLTSSCDQKKYYRVCLLCDSKEWKNGMNADHDWEVVTTPPTCTAEGYDTKTCRFCQKEEIDNQTPIQHEFSDTYCYDEDFHWRACKLCDAEETKNEHRPLDSGRCSDCGALVVPTNGIVYQLSTDRSYAMVTGYSGTEKEVKIAKEYEGVPVKSIKSRAFYQNKELRTIMIPDSVTTIGEYAFCDCIALENLTIPSSVTYISYAAFQGCSSLQTLEIPDSVRILEGYAFKGCASLISVTIGKGATSIANSVLSECPALERILVSEENTAYHSINNCLIQTENKVLIAGCKNSIIPSDGSVTSIAFNAFYGCSALERIVIPGAVTSIGNQAFASCKGLTHLTIENGVLSIGSMAFQFCSALQSVTLPDSVTSIDTNAFKYCSSLVYYEYEHGKYLGNDNNPYIYLAKAKNTAEGAFIIHEDTRMIAEEACWGSKIESVVFPDQLESIDERAFYHCTRLESVVIPDSVTTIRTYAFDSCEALTDIYYTGTEEEWNAIEIGKNAIPSTATIHYNYVPAN